MSEDEKKEEQSLPKKKTPFKLCFTSPNLAGRSDVHIGKPQKLPNIITPKFYSVDKLNQQCSNVDLNKHIEYLNVKGPREKYMDPVTENQRYGWYQVQFTNLDRSDRRLYFAKHTNPIVKEHLMNYENIR